MFLQPKYDLNEWIYLFDTRLIWGSQWHDGVYLFEGGEYRKVDEIEDL